MFKHQHICLSDMSRVILMSAHEVRSKSKSKRNQSANKANTKKANPNPNQSQNKQSEVKNLKLLHLQHFYGGTNNNFSSPRLCLSAHDDYLYCTSQTDCCVYVWDTSTSTVVAKLKAHKKIVVRLFYAMQKCGLYFYLY